MSDYNDSFTAEELASEEWREIPGTEGRYYASNLGRIIGTGGKHGDGASKILAQSTVGGGYKAVKICVDGAFKSKSVHSLVLLTFIGPRPDGYEVNHINFDRTYNRLENLNYMTPAENKIHSIGNYIRGDRHWTRLHPECLKYGSEQRNAKLNPEKVVSIRKLLDSGENMSSIARLFGVCYDTIKQIKMRKAWVHVK